MSSGTLSATRLTSYLFRFMLIFEINRICILEVSETKISAFVGWADDGSFNCDENEEVQEIEWETQVFKNIEDALTVSEFLIDNAFMRNDKITIGKNELFERLGWEIERYESAIHTLLSIKVDMIDDGRKTDYFFVHF